MFNNFFRRIRKGGQRRYEDINPEDIFLDSTNLPGFDEYSLEGRIEKPVGERTFTFLRVLALVLFLGLVTRLWVLEISRGPLYAQISENNRLEHNLIFANRGVIYDRNLVELAYNAVKGSENDFASRIYADYEGLSHVVGYLKYPSKDAMGNYYDVEYHGRDGVELVYDEALSGENGIKLTETDVGGEVTSESVIAQPQDGLPVVLSLDAGVTQSLYQNIKNLAQSNKFVGGAGVIMDVNNGEILALTSYPEYDSNLMTSGGNNAEIKRLLSDPAKPFLNRVIGGLYAPGSILKPVIALGALNEGIISPNKEIYSSGSISVPNPYDPEKPTIFRDWKAHGWTAMREAIAVSSDTYFYAIGGGYQDQKGMGIDRIDKYLRLFGLEDETGISLLGEVGGVIPTPEWKKKTFNGDIWRLGDTYITSIGQYGTQMTPLAAARFVAAIANKGKLIKPTILLAEEDVEVERVIDLVSGSWKVVHEGMREAVTYGSAVGLNLPYVEIAGKTGTAEVGSAKKYVNSWITGFWPYDNPRYAFAIVMEKGPSANTTGAAYVMSRVIDWMHINAPGYLE